MPTHLTPFILFLLLYSCNPKITNSKYKPHPNEVAININNNTLGKPGTQNLEIDVFIHNKQNKAQWYMIPQKITDKKFAINDIYSLYIKKACSENTHCINYVEIASAQNFYAFYVAANTTAKISSLQMVYWQEKSFAIGATLAIPVFVMDQWNTDEKRINALLEKHQKPITLNDTFQIIKDKEEAIAYFHHEDLDKSTIHTSNQREIVVPALVNVHIFGEE